MSNDNYGSVTIVTTVTVEHSLVHIASYKCQTLHKDLHEFLVPMTTRLLQALQHFQQMADLSGGVGCGVAGGLPHVDVLVLGKFTIQVSALDVDLMKFEI